MESRIIPSFRMNETRGKQSGVHLGSARASACRAVRPARHTGRPLVF